ncbi:hypothetical protein [Candidatus Nitronereus thalassa]|uniref:Phage protein n=1 Tax=Candidatus Nitronereus thalassa TaxID=3020898 RepID=A0ABU3K3A3_9BACT|nr:hypothetical protein [Candidatus Nitronereus thalassa]MDT7040872.1 hypothetical protein [Candidatus Nitronereus thalassa]
MSTIQTFELLMNDRLRDAKGLIEQDDKHKAIQQALKAYNKERPRELVQDYSGDGATFDLTLPASWAAEFSLVRSIEYPVGQREPVLLERTDWAVYRTPSGQVLRLQVTPQTGETARVTYTAPHAVDFSSSTVFAQDEEAVADLAASIGLRDLATIFASKQDATIAADSVDHQSKAREFLKLADVLETRYREHVGIGMTTPVQAASTFVDVDQQGPGQGDKLTHPNRYR